MNHLLHLSTYVHGGIQWTTGQSSREIDALAGINAGDGVNSVTIPGSLTPDIINITQTSNVGIPGVWMFRVGEGMCIIYAILLVAQLILIRYVCIYVYVCAIYVCMHVTVTDA